MRTNVHLYFKYYGMKYISLQHALSQSAKSVPDKNALTFKFFIRQWIPRTKKIYLLKIKYLAKDNSRVQKIIFEAKANNFKNIFYSLHFRHVGEWPRFFWFDIWAAEKQKYDKVYLIMSQSLHLLQTFKNEALKNREHRPISFMRDRNVDSMFYNQLHCESASNSRVAKCLTFFL